MTCFLIRGYNILPKTELHRSLQLATQSCHIVFEAQQGIRTININSCKGHLVLFGRQAPNLPSRQVENTFWTCCLVLDGLCNCRCHASQQCSRGAESWYLFTSAAVETPDKGIIGIIQGHYWTASTLYTRSFGQGSHGVRIK